MRDLISPPVLLMVTWWLLGLAAFALTWLVGFTVGLAVRLILGFGIAMIGFMLGYRLFSR